MTDYRHQSGHRMTAVTLEKYSDSRLRTGGNHWTRHCTCHWTKERSPDDEVLVLSSVDSGPQPGKVLTCRVTDEWLRNAGMMGVWSLEDGRGHGWSVAEILGRGQG